VPSEPLALTGREALAVVEDLDVIEGVIASDDSPVGRISVRQADAGDELAARNLFGEANRIAARASSPGTRRLYAAIYRTFADWLREQLGRPPVVGDLDADVIASYMRHLQESGGRRGGPAAPATARVYISLVRALARQLGREDAIADVRAPNHTPAAPETLTDTEYGNLLGVPDRRSLAGKRDYAVLRVLGDCGLRSAELRGLQGRDLRRPRSNARHYRLFVRGKGGREREVPVPGAAQAALDAWLKVHPLARGVALLDEEPLFVRLGRHAHEAPVALSAEAVYRIVSRCAGEAGVPGRLAHPHALRSYWATDSLEAGVPVHEVSARLGHADLRTTARYAAVREERVDSIADIRDRREQERRRAGHR
jgi:site-specific recombinase XerD